MRTTTLLMALVIFASCKAQVENKNVTKTLNHNTMERPIITPEFEKLHLENYKDGLKISKAFIDAGPEKGNEFSMYDYRKVDDTGTKMFGGSFLGGFRASFTKKDSYYTIAKSYYKNGNIHFKCITSSLFRQIKIGKQYFFNQDGKLENIVDHDKGWDYSYEKVIEYILERKLPLVSDNIYYGAEITQEEKEKKYWQLALDTRKTTNKSTWEIVKLDAMTGEILYQIEFEGDRIYHLDLGDNNPRAIEKIIVADKTLKK
ncbi:hypothetical protein [Flavobacterium hercynium]|uniref:Uncharacterized protein n=1 Tax=Flavobacterium hercynium TaxID=387094 RepID=A0A226HGV6_9FLAO|nr:hypothetical protein [Flavobacterium hercynium]OXA93493.1 hypothetical protein B0A66_06595 [Flavobacterium hercynium]SMP32019.1 hypothetical protein SAMN06265346_114105 [Flavobacterium hercynium]